MLFFCLQVGGLITVGVGGGELVSGEAYKWQFELLVH